MALVQLLSKEFHLGSWLVLPIIQNLCEVKETILSLSGFRLKSKEKEEQKRLPPVGDANERHKQVAV
jgi:hypothetical protein